MAVYSRTGRINETAASLTAGAIAGLTAGIVMALAAMFYSLGVGLGFWLPMRNIAALYWGVDALIVGAGAVAVGVFTHLVVSTVIGAGFGLVSRFVGGIGAGLVFGLIYGIAVWAFNTWVILANFNQTMFDRVMVNPWWWFALHWIYGGMLLFTPVLRRRMTGPRHELERQREPIPFRRVA